MKGTIERRLRIWTASLCAAVLTGCATVRNGGAPVASFDLQKDITELEAKFGPSGSISRFYEQTGDKKVARDEFIDGRLALYNVRYIQFIRALGVDKQHLDAATDILLLGLNVAGTLGGGLQAKANLAAASAFTTGTKTTVDKYFYFEKTVPALVATMNAQRKAIFLRIMEGRKKSVDEYPFAQAVADLYEYEQAGSLIGAIDSIQADANVKGTALDKQIRTLLAATPQQISDAQRINLAVAALMKDRTKLAEINRVLKEVGASPSDFTDFDQAAQALENAFRDITPADTQKWLKALQL